MVEVFIEKFKGVKIVYAPHSQMFLAYETFEGKDRHILTADTQANLQHKIEAHLRAAFGKPIEVIDVNNDREVKITSRDTKSSGSVYITWKDESGEAHRSSESVVVRFWHSEDDSPKYRFVRNTPANLEILQRIHDAEAQISDIQKKIAGLRSGYTSPVKEKDVGIPEGEEE